MPSIQIEINGSLREVSKAELFALAKNGEISPETPLHYNGTITVCRKAKGIVFAQAPADEMDYAQTMKPSRKGADVDDFDAAMTKRPPTSLPTQDNLDSMMTMRPQTTSEERKIEEPKSSLADELKRGDVLDGRYQVIKKLGQGGMGAVYKVIDDTTDVEFAIKVVLPEYIADPVALKELRTELAKAQSFTHQNLLNYKFFADTGAVKYIVMELIDGVDLEVYRLQKGGKLSETEAKPIIDQILSGLDYFHDKGLVHLDLKPQNIMISKSGEVKITDYGISTSIKEQIEANAKDGEMMAGTLCFMAPEQLNGSFCDRRTDIYALGLIIYQLLTGELPFELKSKEAIIAWHLDAKHICPKTGSTAFDKVIAKAISYDPKQRFTTCAEIAELSARRTSTQSQNLSDTAQKVIRFIESGGNVNRGIDEKGWTWLHRAADENEVEAIGLLIEAGANVNARENHGLTPLHYAAFRNAVEAIESLVKAGADIKAREKEGGCTPLHSAARNNAVEAIESLVKAGADIKARDTGGWTPLYDAVSNNAVEAIFSLVNLGANVNERDGNGDTPLYVALCNFSLKSIAALINIGADVNMRGTKGDTPLLFIVTWMLDENNDEFIEDALVYNDMSVIVAGTVSDLIAAGADVNARTPEGDTALHWAAYLEGVQYVYSRGTQYIDESIVVALIQGGADVNAKNKNGATPLDVANTEEKRRLLRNAMRRK